jgi:N-acetylglutamate synthase-like GNAT family acetyltransferase
VFSVRKMSSEDFEFAVRLTDTMNWGSVEEDFEFMTRLEPDGCLVLLCNSERVGIATTISYGQVGWIGNVIVSESRRGKGGGSLLVKHAIQYLMGMDVETIGLYSYLDRIPFYSRHNFQSNSRFIVLKGRGFPASIKVRIREADEADMQQIIDLDRQCFGGSRSKLLKPIILDSSNLCHVYAEDDKILGFAAVKVFDDVSEIGPLVCREGHESIAMDLLKKNLDELKGCEVSLCVPEKESKIVGLLAQHGFKESFPLAKMFHGPPVISNHIYVAESLERG